jgi:uncharacterized RDD family membrane protein YckC
VGKRFDEVELYPGTAPLPPLPAPLPQIAAEDGPPGPSAPRFRRVAAFATDLSLFCALALSLSPLVPAYSEMTLLLEREWPALIGIAAFLLLLSFYYFVGTWLVWGRTVGGAIFNVRITAEDGTPADFQSLVRRWGALYLSLGTAGLGFLPALLPGGRSLSDRLSGTRHQSD